MSEPEHIKLGLNGEELASKYLETLGWETLHRNYREKWGEIDIISRDPDKVIVFVEVKTMRPSVEEDGLKPEDQATISKLTKVRRTAEHFANKHFDQVDEMAGWRIDLLAIEIGPQKTNIAHYKNI